MLNIVKESEKFVANLLFTQLSEKFIYHNLLHTQNVVKQVLKLIDTEKIDKLNGALLLISAWFHDTGYTISTDNHEEHSINIAMDFLNGKNISEENKQLIKSLIEVTRYGNKPKTILECILKDADCSHLKSTKYIEYSNLLRYEFKMTQALEFSDLEWTENNINFFTQEHKFYTQYAQLNWKENKLKNLAILFKDLAKHKKEHLQQNQKSKELSLKENKKILPDRGIETMFRVTLRNHIALSDIADTKANILLSVNAIIVSLVLSTLVSKLDKPSNMYLIIPTIIFVLSTVTTMILSVVATRPNVTSGIFTKEDVANKKVNLLFFGNFHKMKLEDFEWAIGEMMLDKKYLYGSMTKDLYFLGKVLDKKYKILRITYAVFIVGILISVLSFAIAFKIEHT